MYIAAGQGRESQWTKSGCQQKLLVTSVICYKFQKNLFEVLILYNFFLDSIHVYSPRAGADNPWWRNFDDNLVTSVICFKFQKNLFEVWFYTIFFHDFINVYSPGAGADSPQGTKF